MMDFMSHLRHGGPVSDSPYEGKTLTTSARPQTLTEMLDSQIAFYEKKISDLQDAKAAISPEVERALNALAKL